MEPGEWFERLNHAGEQGLEVADEPSVQELHAMLQRAWPVCFDGRRWHALAPRRRLDSAGIDSALRTRWLGRPVICFERVDSTNRVARELAGSGGRPGTVVLAEVQTAGRGRLKRQWDSPAGVGLWFSAIFQPPSLSGAPPYALLVSVAVCRAVRNVPGVFALLKWPNDVMIDGRKVCGVLLEAAPDDRSLVAGVGLNVNHSAEDFPEPLRDTATSLRMACGRPVDREAVLAAVLSEMEDRVDRVARDGFRPVMEEYRNLCSTIGMTVRVEMPGRAVVGRVVGVADDGALLLDSGGDGPEPVVVGDVTHLRPVSDP